MSLAVGLIVSTIIGMVEISLSCMFEMFYGKEAKWRLAVINTAIITVLIYEITGGWTW